MNTQKSTIMCIAALLAVWGFTGSVAAVHPQVQPGYNPNAAPFPYHYSQGQPQPNWMAPPVANEDYGGTCCGPRWFDFAVDAVWLDRTDTGIGSQGFTSQGIAGFDPPNLVLTAEDLDFDWEAGIRATVRHQMNAVTSIEAVYMDAINWRTQASVFSDDHDLYSVFSDYGNFPLGGFEETDQATIQEIAYDSDLDSVEVNWRHGWITPSYKHSGAWIFGFRYVKLDERFRYSTEVRPHFDDINNVFRGAAAMDYVVRVGNDLYGPQIGADFMTCLFPSVMLGSEIKAGIFANSAEQRTNITVVNPQISTTTEQASDDDVAFLAEANVYGLIQFHPLWKIRGGYQALYLSEVALGVDNFNEDPPFLQTGRNPFIATNGEAFYHGAYIGVEFGW